MTSWGPYGAPDRIPSNAEAGSVDAGVPVNERTSLQLIAFFACVRLLADTVASLPWDSYRRREGQRVEVDPQPSLLADPFSELTDFEWKHMLMVSLAMRGNFYGAVIERDRLEYPTQIMPLHPDSVRRDRDPRTGRRRAWVEGDAFPVEDLFHVRGFTLPGAEEGLSTINAARQSIGLGIAAQRFGARWFGDGAAPSSVLESDQAVDDDTALLTQKRWISSHGGRRYPAVLSGGFKWKPITITPEESQFLETRKLSWTEMAMLVGVPPYMIGHTEKSTSWGTGIEQQSIGFVTYNLRSWLTRVEAAVTQILPRGQFVKFNVDALLRGDIKTRFEAYRIAIEGGFRNPDEVRALEDLPPIPDGLGEQFRQPLNFGPLGVDPEGDSDEGRRLGALIDGMRRYVTGGST